MSGLGFMCRCLFSASLHGMHCILIFAPLSVQNPITCAVIEGTKTIVLQVIIQVQRSAKRFVNLAKQDPGKARQSS